MHNTLKALRAQQKRRCEKNHRLIYEYLLTHACVDCGESDPVVLDFDHALGRKEGDTDVTSLSGSSWVRIQKEIDKCEVVCSNCHRKRSAQRKNNLRWRLQHKEL